MNVRRQALPASVAVLFALVVMRWPEGPVTAVLFAVGGVGLEVYWRRRPLAREQPGLAAALSWGVLPVAVGGVGLLARVLTGWEALSVAGLAIGCAPLAVAWAPAPGRRWSGSFAMAMVLAAVLWPLASLCRPDVTWPLAAAVVPYGVALLGALGGLREAERRRAQGLALLHQRATTLSLGQPGQEPALDGAGAGARSLLDELAHWREELARAQAGARSTGPRLLQFSVALEGALVADQRGARAWSEALETFRASTERLLQSAQQISLHLDEVSAVTETVDLAASQDERGASAFFASMDQLTQHSLQVADEVRSLNMRMQLVGTIVDAITSIADRAELLAVNAELESSRAAEVERAFSLLAAEMRRMSELTIRSVQAVSAEIGEVVEVSTAAASAANAAVVASHDCTRLGHELTRCLVELLDHSRQTATAMSDIRTALWAQRQAGAHLGDRGQLLQRVSGEAFAVASKLETVTAEIRTLGTSLSPGGKA